MSPFFKISAITRHLLFLIIPLIFSLGTTTCKKIDRIPKIATSPPTRIADTSVELHASVIELNGDFICEDHGFFLSDSNDSPDQNNQKVTLGLLSKKGKVTFPKNGLKPKTKYYYRAFIRDDGKYILGEPVSFLTTGKVPAVETVILEYVTDSFARCVARVVSGSGFDVTERGICLSTKQNPTVADGKIINGLDTGYFYTNISGLLPNQQYFVRAYAINTVGTGYGEELSFTTGKALPVVVLDSASAIKSTSATINTNVLGDGGTSVTERGVCLTITSYASNCFKKNIEGSGTGKFSSNFTGLTSGQTYYCRAYAINSEGTQYSNEISFKTKSLADVQTVQSTIIKSNSATISGKVSDDGGYTVSERGFCWAKWATPTINSDKVTSGSGVGDFSGSLTGLDENSNYYVRAYAINDLGVSYGNILTVKTLLNVPVVTTGTITSFTGSSATVAGEVVSSAVWVDTKGICYSTSSNPTVSDSKTTHWNGVGPFTSNLTGLLPNTIYYVRAYGTNSTGTGYGIEKSFKTTAQVPTVTTSPVTDIAPTTATSGGNITSDGGSTVTERGICWSTSNNPTISNSKTTSGTGSGSFTSALSGLKANITYYVRAYAKNSLGIAYGNQVTFSFSVGTKYGGGVVFYIDGTGTHGLIAAETDQSNSAPWGCQGKQIYYTSELLGLGMGNTKWIVNNCQTAGIAARLCDNLSLNGYNDWYLPSLDELILLYTNRTLIGGFSNYYYWSSTEFNGNVSPGAGTYAWLKYFLNGTQTYSYKKDSYRVRAIRSF